MPRARLNKNVDDEVDPVLAFEGPWTSVKFHLDDQVVLRPVEFFKDSATVKAELAENLKRDVYFVFWSENPKDTPESVSLREGKLLFVDQVLDPEIREKGPGWYKATLRQYAGKFVGLETTRKYL